jgi:tRNA nucleotidyltransferase (CCA-adding enzyme)
MEFIKSLSGKRIFMELQLILNEEKILSIIKRMAEFGLLTYIHPDIQYNMSLKTVLKNSNAVLSWFDLLFLDRGCERWLLFFLALTDQLSPEDVETLCVKLHINKRHADTVQMAKSQGLEVLRWMLTKRSFKSSELYRRLNALPVEVCLYIMAKTNHPGVKRAVSLYFTHLQNICVQVKGDDLIRMGIKPGKIYKRILDDLHDAVLDEKVAGRDSEIAFIKKKYAHEIKSINN